VQQLRAAHVSKGGPLFWGDSMTPSRKYGCIPDRFDPRDIKLTVSQAPHLGTEADLSKWASPAREQKGLGACVGFAGCGFREWIYRYFAKWKKGDYEPLYSPLDLYYRLRRSESTTYEDGGATLRTLFHVLTSEGVALEYQKPYDVSRWLAAPTPAENVEALHARLGAYHRMTGLDTMRSCLAGDGPEKPGYPFVAGIAIYEGFETVTSGTGVLELPRPGDIFLGGHAVLVLGYNDRDRMFKARNSWGPKFGDGGDFRMPYEYAADPKLLFDAWMGHLGKPWKLTTPNED